MAWYVVLDALSIEDDPGGGGRVGFPMLEDDSGNAVVPLFTSEERYWDFARECQFEEDLTKPFPMPFDIFKLGELLKPLSEGEEVRLTALDPFVVGDSWESLARPCSLKEFCLFLEKFHPVAQGLVRDGVSKFGSTPEDAARIMSWAEPLLAKKAGDVLSIVREYLVEGDCR